MHNFIYSKQSIVLELFVARLAMQFADIYTAFVGEEDDE